MNSAPPSSSLSPITPPQGIRWSAFNEFLSHNFPYVDNWFAIQEVHSMRQFLDMGTFSLKLYRDQFMLCSSFARIAHFGHLNYWIKIRKFARYEAKISFETKNSRDYCFMPQWHLFKDDKIDGRVANRSGDKREGREKFEIILHLFDSTNFPQPRERTLKRM